jgi:hypothetical protein
MELDLLRRWCSIDRLVSWEVMNGSDEIWDYVHLCAAPKQEARVGDMSGYIVVREVTIVRSGSYVPIRPWCY